MEISNRHKAYEKAYDSQIINRIPVIIRCDGKNFHRVTKKLPRPYSKAMQQLMANTMLMVAKSIEGCVFAYQQSDEITFILRNDQSLNSEPWFNNRTQKIASVTSSMLTSFFKDFHYNMENPLELIGPVIFDARVFAVPSITEAINNLIFRQEDCVRNAINAISLAELSKEYGRKTAMKLLDHRNTADRINLLRKECNIDIENYPIAFRHGIAAYRVTKLFETSEGQITRQRWVLDTNLPRFINDKPFINGILNSGQDIFRIDRDLDSAGRN